MSFQRIDKVALKRAIRCLLPSLAALIVFASLAAYAIASWRATHAHPFRPLPLRGQWIRAAGSLSRAAYFRKRFDLSGTVRRAWIVVAACDAFEVSVNRNPMGHMYLWRPTRSFQSGLSEKGQTVYPQEPAMALNFPREYQWEGHASWKLPVYVDLTNSLQTGKNIVCVEAESRRLPAKVSFHGEIQLWNGQVIPICSDESWRGEPQPIGPRLHDWTELYYWDLQWGQAQTCEGPAECGLRTTPEEIYTRPFTGEWLKHPSSTANDAIRFQTTWHLDRDVDEAWLRLVTNRRYELYVNGARVSVSTNKPPDLDNGDWIFGRTAAVDPITRPELLDPDEVGDLFVGERFESPRKADQALEEFIPIKPIENLPFRYHRTTNRSEPAGIYDPQRTLAQSRRTPETPDLFPQRPAPHSLKRERSLGGFLAYSIGPLLRVGDNTIEVRCVAEPETNWTPQIAVDGGARLTDGRKRCLPAGADWTTCRFSDQRTGSFADSHSTLRQAVSVGPVHQIGAKLPKMQYRGVARPADGIGVQWPRALKQTFALSLGGYAIILLVAVALPTVRRTSSPQKADPAEQPPLWVSTAEVLYSMLLVASVTLITGVLLRSSWAERHEMIWFSNGTAWRWLFYATASVAILVGVVDCMGRVGLSRLRSGGHRVTGSLRSLPQTRLWPHLVFWVLLVCVLLRAYKLDLQPLDDDEYASTQAVMAILETGTPKFVPDDVFYTRSPLYHYLTAAVAYPFGGDLWSLRLQSVAWSALTAWLTYLCGSMLLGSRWVGWISMLLITIHPFEIFTGHVVRFYQMQQFFALLTVYLFCRGFVTSQRQSYRIATVLVFVAAVLSQEISAAMGIPLLIGYVLFAKDFGWRSNIQLIVVSALALSFIVLDYLVFQTLCLTRTEGVSPNIEATIRPHFWHPLNLFSIFVGYSRLHVVPSAFFFAGLPLLWREQNRNTLALVVFLISGILMTNLLVTHVSMRYLYWLFPIWLLLSVDGARLVLASAVKMVYRPKGCLNRYVVTLGASSVVVIAGMIASFSPWRIPGSYEMSVLGDSTGCVRYVRSQMREGDQLAITEPHTHTALIESGKVDFDVSIPLLYDFAVMRDGRMVDRNGGGELITSVDDLIDQLGRGNRLWILVNREKFRSRGKNLRWEYPGARFEVFLRKNCELRHRTYLWSAYLWDPARGHYVQFRHQE